MWSVTAHVLRAFGLAPYSASAAGPEKYRLSRVLASLNVVGLCVLNGVIGYVKLFRYARIRDHISSVQHMAGHMLLALNCLYFVYLCLAITVKMPQILAVLNSQHFTSALRTVSPGPSLVLVLSYLAGLFFVDSSGSLLPAGQNENLPAMIHYVCEMYLACTRVLEVGYFAFLLSCVTVRFEKLKSDVTALLDGHKTRPLYHSTSGISDTEAPVLAIRSISVMHRELVDLTEVVSGYFGPQILIDLILEAYWSVSALYFLITGPFHILRLVDPLKSIFSRACLILLAHHLSKTGNGVIAIVHSFRNLPGLLDKEKSELEILALDTFHRQVRVSLGGVVDLNSFFLFRVAMAMTTAIVILLQFQID